MLLSPRRSRARSGPRHRAGLRGMFGPERRGLPRGATTHRRRARAVQLLVLTMVAGVLLGMDRQPNAAAAIAADFDPGNIISDTVFFNSSAMSANAVQAFLDSKGRDCVNGEQRCLKSYVTTTVAKANDGLCRGYAGGRNESAAQIIVGVAQSCGINPQVLLVLLEKEQSLVTRSAPTTLAYRAATGMGCPDTAACNSQYYGYFNQVYGAARQYQYYAANPQNYRYKAGQTVAVQWHPNAGCGSRNITIANQATAGLYIYTPYQPNAAALSNLYGTGDSCSAYGNRNFWRIFTDWFGNPQVGSFLMRSTTSTAVWLVSGTKKYNVRDMATVHALRPLGTVRFVSQQYLDRRTTVSPMSRVVLAPTGTVYFLDAGMKLRFNSCAQVADYGADCSSLVRLDQSLIDAFATGPAITPLYRTTSGKAFYVSGGAKREAADDAALAAAGLPTSGVRLLESGLDYLPHGVPVVRDGIVLRNRQTGAAAVAAGGTYTVLSAGVREATALASWPVRDLDYASLRRLTIGSASGAWVREAGGSQVFLLTETGRREVTDASLAPASVPQVPAALMAAFPDAGTLDAGTFLKGSGRGTVYVPDGGLRRPVLSWADLVALNGGASPAGQILTVDQRLVDLLPTGPAQLGPGSLVVSPAARTVYFVNGTEELIPLPNFGVAAELGVARMVRVAAADVAGYTARTARLSTAIDCGGTPYLGLGGKRYEVGAGVAAHYGLSYTGVDPLACAALPEASMGLTRFLRASTGTIYYIENGTKRPIRNYARYTSLGGNSSNTIQTSDFALAQIPTGPTT